jgi:membrane protein required for colicin V production
MNSLDWIFCATGLFALINGLWQGLIKEVLGLVAWVIGFIAAQTFASGVGAQLPVSGASPELRYLMGFVCVLVMCLISVSLVAKLLSTLISAIGLGFVNSFMGALFALGKVSVLCLCLTTIVRLTPLQELDMWKQSLIADQLVAALNLIKPLLPQEFGKYVN